MASARRGSRAVAAVLPAAAAPAVRPRPLHVLGSGSIGLLFASSVRREFPTYPLTMLLRPKGHRSRVRRRTVAVADAEPPRAADSAAGGCHVRPEDYIVASLTAPAGPTVKVELPAEIIHPVVVCTDGGSDGTTVPPLSPIRNLIVATKAPDAAAALRSVVHRLDSTGGHRAAANVVILCNGAMAVRDELEEVLVDVGRRVATDEDEEDDGGDGTALGHDVERCDAEGGGNLSNGDDGGGGAVRLVLASTTHGAHRGPLNSDREEDDDDDDATNYRVVHAGLGQTYVQSHPFADLFSAAGLRASYASPAEMYVLLWKKLAANCVINPLTALRGCRNGDLLTEEGSGGVFGDDAKAMNEIVREVALVAAMEVRAAAEAGTLHLGCDDGSTTTCSAHLIEEELGYASLRSFVDGVVRGTADNTSSMLQDVTARRHPTEVSYLNGYVARIGRERHGLDVPYNEDVCGRVERLTSAFVGS